VLISRELLGLDEFVLERFEGLLIQMKLHLECPICHALPVTKEVNNLIKVNPRLCRGTPKV